jgi:hypothetical protein
MAASARSSLASSFSQAARRGPRHTASASARCDSARACAANPRFAPSEAADENAANREIEIRPYYVTAQLPRAAKPEFMLMLPLSGAGKNQMMAGWLG